MAQVEAFYYQRAIWMSNLSIRVAETWMIYPDKRVIIDLPIQWSQTF